MSSKDLSTVQSTRGLGEGEIFSNMVGILTARASLSAVSWANTGADVKRERFEGKVAGSGCLQTPSMTVTGFLRSHIKLCKQKMVTQRPPAERVRIRDFLEEPFVGMYRWEALDFSRRWMSAMIIRTNASWVFSSWDIRPPARYSFIRKKGHEFLRYTKFQVLRI